jgi:calcineurin-like phosphoesterase family protein
MIWFTSDYHLDHKNILEYSNRPFSTVEEMNEVIIGNCNDLVYPNDDLIYLGDFAFNKSIDRILELRRKIRCRKLYFIFGNHDKLIRKNAGKLFPDFQIWGDYAEETLVIPKNGGEKKLFVLSHYAFRTWNKSHYGSYQLYGHSHGSLPDDPNSLSFDVGVDCHDYKPINIDRVVEIMNKKTWKPIDHHGKREIDKGKFRG